ncbi:hypothetical protein MNEG_3560, partial [Monoraphidium neglectum]
MSPLPTSGVVDFESAWAAAVSARKHAASGAGPGGPVLPPTAAAAHAPAACPSGVLRPPARSVSTASDEDPLMQLYGSYLRQGSATFSLAFVQPIDDGTDGLEGGAAAATGSGIGGGRGLLRRGSSLIAVAAEFATTGADGRPGLVAAQIECVSVVSVAPAAASPAWGVPPAARLGPATAAPRQPEPQPPPMSLQQHPWRQQSFDLIAAAMRLPSGDVIFDEEFDAATLLPEDEPRQLQQHQPQDSPALNSSAIGRWPDQPPAECATQAQLPPWAGAARGPADGPHAPFSRGQMPPPPPVALVQGAGGPAWHRLRRASFVGGVPPPFMALAPGQLQGSGGSCAGGGGGSLGGPVITIPLHTRLSSMGSADSAHDAFAPGGAGAGAHMGTQLLRGSSSFEQLQYHHSLQQQYALYHQRSMHFQQQPRQQQH